LDIDAVYDELIRRIDIVDILEKDIGHKKVYKLAQKILKRCRGEINPVDLIRYAYNPTKKIDNPQGFILAACNAPGKYDMIEPWSKFVERVWPADKSVESLAKLLKDRGF
jgi:hypothetical protein